MKSIFALLFLVGSLAIAGTPEQELQKIKDRINTETKEKNQKDNEDQEEQENEISYENAAGTTVTKDEDGNIKETSYTNAAGTKVIKKQND